MKLLKKIRKRLLRLNPKKRVAKHQDTWFLLDPLNWIDNRLLAGLGYEQPLIDHMLQVMGEKQIDLMLDIGANIGYFSLLAARHSTVREIHAFEPVKRNLFQFHGSLYLNGFEHRVTTHPCGLSETAGEAVIHIDPRSTGISRLSLDHAQRDTKVFTQQETIQIAVLDAVLPLSGRKAFVKIDTEGHELNVLRGMAAFLASNRCYLQVEVSPENEKGVDSLLQAAGYTYLRNAGDNAYYSNF